MGLLFFSEYCDTSMVEIGCRNMTTLAARGMLLLMVR